MSYVSEAAELFQTLNPQRSVLSPNDYLTIAEWEKQEIPLPLVLNAIRQFSNAEATRSVINLDEIRQDVKDIYAAWLCGEGPPAAQYIRNR